MTVGDGGRRPVGVPPRQGSHLSSTRLVLYGILAAVAAVAPFVVLLPPPLRVTVGFIFILFGPGTAIAGWFPQLTPIAELLIAVVLSLVLTTAAGEVMLTVRAWSPAGYAAVVAPVVVIMLVRHIICLALGRFPSVAHDATERQ
jgi:hypothetical protein